MLIVHNGASADNSDGSISLSDCEGFRGSVADLHIGPWCELCYETKVVSYDIKFQLICRLTTCCLVIGGSSVVSGLGWLQ